MIDADRSNYSKEVQKIYDDTKTYHDGKWLMFEPTDTTLFDDFVKLLDIVSIHDLGVIA